MNIAFFDTKEYDRAAFLPYDGREGLRFQFYETRLNGATAPLARGADAVCAFVNDEVDRAVIEKLYGYGIRLIALRCAGFNHIDLTAAFGKIHVVRVPAYSPCAVAEHTFALLLTSIRRVHKAYHRTRDFNFSLNGLTGFELHGKTLGVIGTGRIGQQVIAIARGFGMRILAYDRRPVPLPGVTYGPPETLFRESDVITLHCPLTEDSYHMIGRESLAKMKKGVVIVNTSRGALIDAEALLESIKNRQVGAACLDVYEEEADLFFEDFSGHIVQDDTLARLITMPNVLVTSHQAFLTEEALRSIAETTVRNLLNYFRDEKLENEICYRCASLPVCQREGKKRCF